MNRGPSSAAFHLMSTGVQRGVSLIFALLALAALSLAAVALVRSVDSGTLLLGNLGFKQDATAASDRMTERARAWLMDGSNNLTIDGPGYYATSQDGLDPTGRLTSASNRMAVVRWDNDSCACMAEGTCLTCDRIASNEETFNGGLVRARYLITRLCPNTGAVTATNACAQPAVNAISSASARGEVRVGTEDRPSEAAQIPYYRIIVRTVSGRNSVSFTETIIY